MNSARIPISGIETLSIRQIIDLIKDSGKFSNVSDSELDTLLLDRRPVELLLLMKECTHRLMYL